jgi:hypothetical protein
MNRIIGYYLAENKLSARHVSNTLLFDGIEEVEEFFGFFTAFFSVADEGDSVGAFAVDHFGVAGEDRFDDLGVAEHGVDKEVSPGTLADEVGGDFAVADMSGGSNCRFKIAVCPVPDGIEESGVLGEEFFDEVGGKGGFAVLGFDGSGDGGESSGGHCAEGGSDELAAGNLHGVRIHRVGVGWFRFFGGW